MKTKSTRFRDDRTLLSAFRDEILVYCPRCAKCARFLSRPHPELSGVGLLHYACDACGLVNPNDLWARFEDSGRDLFSGYPLYLTTTCAGGYLWAYNYRHLAWMEEYVQATLRETRRDPKWGWCNQSAANRLPAWIKSAKNRRAVLQGIAKIRRKSLTK